MSNNQLNGNLCAKTDLKRFSPGERFRKLEGNVDFPLSELDLSAYASPGVRPPSGTYQMYGVINHSGSAYMGHYTAYCRHPFTNSWHEYNDSKYSFFHESYWKIDALTRFIGIGFQAFHHKGSFLQKLTCCSTSSKVATLDFESSKCNLNSGNFSMPSLADKKSSLERLKCSTFLFQSIGSYFLIRWLRSCFLFDSFGSRKKNK